MKTTLLLLSLCLCFINHLSISISAAAAQPPPPVLDTDGKELLARANYKILLVNERVRVNGGITLYNKRCPLDVVVLKDQTNTLFPVQFRPVNPNDTLVRLSTDLNIIFDVNTTCPQWKLDYDESIFRHFVTTGGVEGNPGPTTINNWFKIEEFGSGYKFVFCPSVCATCRHVCGDLSVLVQDYESGSLVLSVNEDDGPIMVNFQKE